jgi:hypothetical protein
MTEDTDDDDIRPGYEKATRSALGRFADIVESNAKLALLLVFLTAVLQWTGVINLGLPAWWPIGLVVLVVAGLAAYLGGQAIDDELDEEEKVIVVDQGRERVWKLSTDRFAELEKDGELNNWEGASRCFEVSRYETENDRLVGNYRAIPPDSDFREKQTVDDVETKISSLKNRIGPMVDMAMDIRANLGDIAREIDRRRTEQIAGSMEEMTVDAPIEGRDDTISGVLEDVLDDELNPNKSAEPGRGETSAETDPDAGNRTNGSADALELDDETREVLKALGGD